MRREGETFGKAEAQESKARQGTEFGAVRGADAHGQSNQKSVKVYFGGLICQNRT